MSQQLRVVAPTQGVTLFFQIPLYGGSVPAGSQRYFASDLAAYNFLNAAPECVQTNVPYNPAYGYGNAQFVYVTRGFGCYPLPPRPPQPWCPCANNGPYY